MNYLQSPLYFKVKKVLRYIKIYGIRRTYIKVLSQIHMQKSTAFNDEWINPKYKKRGQIAIIGCGNFSFSTIAYFINQYKSGLIKYTFDPNHSRAISLCKKYNAYKAIKDYKKILSDPEIKLVYVVSNHASHAEYAIEAIENGKSVHIEKPATVNIDQLDRLIHAMQHHPDSKVFIGFNRPKSKLFNNLLKHAFKENGPTMINWFIAGHKIEQNHWYFSPKEGGRVMGNLCHWTDLCLHILEMNNIQHCYISPAKAITEKSDIAVNITFSDGSIAGMTFSAKEDPFEGIKERLHVHKGNLFAALEDFSKLTMEIGHKKIKYKSHHRDHGHKKNVTHSLCSALDPILKGETIKYIYDTNILALKIKEAVETGKVVKCTFYTENSADLVSNEL